MRMTSAAPDWNPQWWLDPWWEHADYQHESKLSLEQIRAAVDALRQLFDGAWTERAMQVGPPNAVIPILFGGRGLIPFSNLMWLARIAQALSDVPTVQRPLRDLMTSKTKATLFELEVASLFAEQGWAVEFLKPSGERRSPDIQVQKSGLCSAIECKRFGSEQWEEWASSLSLELIQRTQTNADTDLPRFEIIFEPRLSDVVWGDDAVLRAAMLEEIAVRIADGVREATAASPPTSVSVEGIANVRLVPGVEKGGLQAIGGIEISPQAKMRRIVCNGILEAAQQLAAHSPGVVAISSDFTPPKPLADAVLGAIHRARPALLQSVGVVMIPGTRGSPGVVWRNPVWADHPVCNELTSTIEIAMAPPARPSASDLT